MTELVEFGFLFYHHVRNHCLLKAKVIYLNGLGDVVALTDGSGNVVVSYTYDPWGQTVNKTGTLYNPFTYRGYYQDDEAGLYYLINRYYDPQDGRFLSQDTIEPLSANLYSYTSDDPVNFTDPNGEKYGSHDVEEFANFGQALLDMYLSYTNRNTKTLWDIKKKLEIKNHTIFTDKK